MKKTVYLYVERDDSEYDYKAGFASYTEANDYRQECQRSWIGHCDYVYLWTGSERINLTRMPKDERNDIRGTVSSEADFRSDTYSGTKFNPCFRNIVAEQLIKIYSNMVTMKFSATKSKTMFLTPTIAVEQDNSETAIRFALWHGVFSVEVSKSYKTVKAK